MSEQAEPNDGDLAAELIRRRIENNFLKSLMGREDWLTKEISNGGNWEHLNARRAECAYIRERLTNLFGGLDPP